MWAIIKQDELYHHGILGMHWGKKNGPPYPLGSGDHSASEKKAGWRKSLDKSTKKYSSYDLSKYADKDGKMSVGKQIKVHNKLEKKNVQTAYKNIKNNIQQYNRTKKRLEKGKNVSEKEQYLFEERKKIMDQAISEIDKSIKFQASRKNGVDFVNKAIMHQQFKDTIVGSAALTAAYSAGAAFMTSMGVPNLPRVMVIPDFAAGQARKYINENSKKITEERAWQQKMKDKKKQPIKNKAAESTANQKGSMHEAAKFTGSQKASMYEAAKKRDSYNIDFLEMVQNKEISYTNSNKGLLDAYKKYLTDPEGFRKKELNKLKDV